MDTAYLKKLRIVCFAEGTSTLLLFFVAMPLKYLADIPMAVSIVGSLHGLLFVAMVSMLGFAIDLVPIPKKLALICAVGAVFPFVPFYMDRYLQPEKLPKVQEQSKQ